MGLFDKWRGKDEIMQLKEQLNSVSVEVSNNNELYKAINKYLSSSFGLDRGDLENAVKHGYEGNVSCFGLINTLSTIFAEPEDKLFLYKGGEKEEVDPEKYGINFLQKPNHYQSWSEFKKHWAASYYTCGNSEVYAPILENGNNKGRLMEGIYIMPAQNVTIYAENWKTPIKRYGFDIDGGQVKIEAQHIWHERFAPNLSFTNGLNYYGISPVLVALNVILAQNEGYEFISNTYAKRLPPFVFFSDDEGKINDDTRRRFNNTYKKHYQGNDGTPMLANKGRIEKIGFDSFRDLQVLDTLADGQRQLATALGVDARIINDIAGTTFNNQQEAMKKLYNLRIKPDWRVFYDGINTDRLQAYAPEGTELRLEPDLSQIEALKANLELMAKVYDIGVKNKAVSRNEFREALGLDIEEREDMDATGDDVLDDFPTLFDSSNNIDE